MAARRIRKRGIRNTAGKLLAESSRVFLPDHLDQVRAIAMRGLTEDQIGEIFDISPRQLGRWKAQYPAFKEALNSGYTDADAAVEAVNDWVVESDEIMAPLVARQLLTDEPFDEPIDFVYFDLWHHWGRTAKFGSWMGGPDYVQWHGAYELLADLAELREMAAERLGEGQGE